EEEDLPWNYKKIVKHYLDDSKQLMDYDTGGAEFLLSLNHPYNMTSATEGYKPNVELCKERLLPLGVNFKECFDPRHIPFGDDSFDLMINRHGNFEPNEIYRLLKKGGIFITEQVGSNNNRDLVDMVLPKTPQPYPHLNLMKQRAVFEKAGFQIVKAEEAFRPIKFYDVGAFVWFAHIIEWEFPNFSVDRCFEQLLKMQKKIEKCGKVEGTIHRFLIVATK
ncbi:MAG: SAM-dependent methyltransferase, partial [Ruminococcus sp.]